ncbi:hypothetical protein RBB50_002219 [Rhinocladiella similis]
MASFAYEPDDVYWGQLAGCMDSLNAGTTTVLDHSHASYTSHHANRALSASISSGLRTIFAYMTLMPRFAEWNKNAIKPNFDFLPEWPIEQLESWSRKGPFASGRVQLGFAFDFFFLPPPLIASIFERVRTLKSVKLITCHTGKTATMGSLSQTSVLESIGQLKGPLVFSHANNFTQDEYVKLSAHNIGISTTPCTEYQIGNTNPVAFHPDFEYPHISLGVDCHSICSSSMPAQVRAALLCARAIRANRTYIEQDKAEPREIHGTAQEAFNLITIKGAAVLGMDQEIGSIAVGKKADIVVFNATTPNMLCAAEYDAVTAVIMHSEVSDVDAVIVDGVIRKMNRGLLPVEHDMEALEPAKEGSRKGGRLEWQQVAAEVLRSRREIQARLDNVSEDKARDFLIKSWHIDEERLV